MEGWIDTSILLNVIRSDSGTPYVIEIANGLNLHSKRCNHTELFNNPLELYFSEAAMAILTPFSPIFWQLCDFYNIAHHIEAHYVDMF